MAIPIKFFKIKTMPTLIEPDCIYIIKGDTDTVANIYASSNNGQLIALTNEAVINALIADAVAGLPPNVEIDWNRNLVGTKDGINPTFTTPNPFVVGNITIKLNGLEQTETIDYVISGQNITFFTSPSIIDTITGTYIKQ